MEIAGGYFRRVAHLHGLTKYDVVLCDQEFFPYFPVAAELLAASRCARLIVDYDDAAYFKYRHIPVLRNRIPELMASAEAVVVGNRHLRDFASQHNRNVHVIPTVVDLARYKVKQNYSAPQGVKLVWIGTPVTAGFLKQLAPVLVALKTKYRNLQLHLIGADQSLREVLPCAEVLPWTEASEARLLAECDIGIMPLPDTEFTRGKCGLKLIQCMAAGLPVVASPVGANRDIIGEGHDGFLADAPDEWFQALERLIVSETLRRELGRNGVVKARERYSLEQGFSAWMRIIDPDSYSRQTAQGEPSRS
jgi:glycosyltransferase involved in cell wall biosynthesis